MRLPFKVPLGTWGVSLGLLVLTACNPADEALESFEQARQGALSAAFSSHGEYAFVGSFNHGGSLWHLADDARLFDWNHVEDGYSAIRAAAFSADDRYVVTTEQRSLVLWDVATGAGIRYWTAPARILSVALSGDAEYALLGLEDNRAVLFNTMQGGVVGSLAHDGPVNAVTVNSAATLAATGSDDHTVALWSLDTGERLHVIEHAAPVTFTHMSRDGSLLVTGAYQDTVSIWQTRTARRVTELYRRNPGITAARFADDRARLATGTSREKVLLWRVDNGERLATWTVPKEDQWHRAAILALSFGPNGERLFAAASTGTSYVFKL